MKVEVMKTPKAFAPITLTITLETGDELLDMYVRNRVTNKKIADHVEANYPSVFRGVAKEDYIRACNSINSENPAILKALRPLVEAL